MTHPSPDLMNDVLWLRGRFQTHSDVPPLIHMARLSQKYPQWWMWLPHTTRCLQKKAEKLLAADVAKHGHIAPHHRQTLRAFFNRHLPVSLDGWTVYRRLVPPEVFAQRLKRRLSSATAESYCTLYKAYLPVFQGAAPPHLGPLLVHLTFCTVVPVKRLLAALGQRDRGKPPLPEHRLLAQLLGSIPCAHPLAAYQAYVAKKGASSSWMTPLTIAAILHGIRHNHSQKVYDLYMALPKRNLDIKSANTLATMVKRQLWQEGQKSEVKGRLAQARSWYRLALQVPLQGAASDRTQAEYMHGLICLFGLGNPQKAMGHFVKSSKKAFTPQQLHPQAVIAGKQPLHVRSPIGVGRHDVATLFWLGACAHRLGKPKLATTYWQHAARYSLFGYGQWALWMLKRPIAVSFPKRSPSAQGWKTAPLQLCHYVVDVWSHYSPKTNLSLVNETTYPLCLDIMDLSQSPAALAYTLHMVKKIYPRYVCESGTVLGKHYAGMFQETYPTPDLQGMRKDVDDVSLMYSIIRTESSFRPTTIVQTIRENIKGYMMVRRITAEFITKKNAIPLNEERFKKDPSYHIFLGSLTLANILKRAFGSYPVAIAAYNGGMASTHQWKASIPWTRSDPFHALYWIESIPFSETRHYVMRVLETYGIYRTLLHKPISVKEWTALTTIRTAPATPKVRP